jgi:hypothetical protein
MLKLPTLTATFSSGEDTVKPAHRQTVKPIEDSGDVETHFGDGSYIMHGRYYVAPAQQIPGYKYPSRIDI